MIDSTGMETHHVSRYYRWKKESQYPGRTNPIWPKVTLVVHRKSHWILGLHVCQGPTQDAHLLRKVMPEVESLVHLDRLLADRGYDSELNHIFCREKLKIRSTVIPTRRCTDGLRVSQRWPKTKYRRQMKRRFQKHIYRQRVQVECVIFRLKKHFGADLQARRWMAQVRECRLRILTFNLGLVAQAWQHT